MTNKTVPQLTAGTLSADGVMHFVDADGNSRKITLADLKTFINTDPTVVPSSEPYRGARVRRTSNLSITANTVTVVTWQAADRDTDSIWSAGAPTRLTVPTGVTKVRLSAQLRYAASASVFVLIGKNGDTPNGAVRVNATGTGLFGATDVLDVVAGDYFECSAFSAGSSPSVTADYSTWFAMQIIEASA